jgi:hypothetical protein
MSQIAAPPLATATSDRLPFLPRLWRAPRPPEAVYAQPRRMALEVVLLGMSELPSSHSSVTWRARRSAEPERGRLDHAPCKQL